MKQRKREGVLVATHTLCTIKYWITSDPAPPPKKKERDEEKRKGQRKRGKREGREERREKREKGEKKERRKKERKKKAWFGCGLCLMALQPFPGYLAPDNRFELCLFWVQLHVLCESVCVF